MEYLDFEIEIGTGHGRDHPVTVVRSPVGERRGTMHFPFDDIELENHLLKLQNALLGSATTRRRSGSLTEDVVEDFGSALFDSLLVGDIRTCFELSRREAQVQGKGLRIKMRVDDPELAVLPWEYLYDRGQGEFTALSRYTPVVRYIDVPRIMEPLSVAPPIRILGMVASPDDLPPLNVERERQRVERAIAPLQAAGRMELTWLEGGTWQELQRAMRRGTWHIFHFVGHGRFDVNQDEGMLALVSETGETDELTATQVGRLLSDHPSLRLALLNACEGAKGGKADVFSGTAATLVRRGLPAVVAMQYEITDRAAIEFARTFYEAVADELPLDAAVSEARKSVSLSISGTVEWGTPVLFMRSPDGVLFKVDPSAPAASSAPKATAEPPPSSAGVPLGAGLMRPGASAPAADPEEIAVGSADAPPGAQSLSAIMPAPEPLGGGAPPSVPEELDNRTIQPEEGWAPPAGPTAVPPQPSHDPPPAPVATPAATPATPPTPAATPPTPAAPTPAPIATTPTPPVAAATPPPIAAMTPVPVATPAAPQYAFYGTDGRLEVAPGMVALRRTGAGGVMLRPGEREIPMAMVTAVHLAPASPQGQGFIQVCYQGGTQVRTTFWAASKHPDTVLFTLDQQPQFVSAKQWIEYYASAAQGGRRWS